MTSTEQHITVMQRVSVFSPTPITCTGEGNYFSVILTLKQIDIVSGDSVAGKKKKKRNSEMPLLLIFYSRFIV